MLGKSRATFSHGQWWLPSEPCNEILRNAECYLYGNNMWFDGNNTNECHRTGVPRPFKIDGLLLIGWFRWQWSTVAKLTANLSLKQCPTKTYMRMHTHTRMYLEFIIIANTIRTGNHLKCVMCTETIRERGPWQDIFVCLGHSSD